MKFPDKFRVRRGEWGTNYGDPFGAFFVPVKLGKPPLQIIACDGAETGWEHVSVSLPDRCPTWDEMCFVKDLFWEQHECVVQFHPPRDQYVNNHDYCLHLWRVVDREFPVPPSILVGVKGFSNDANHLDDLRATMLKS